MAFGLLIVGAVPAADPPTARDQQIAELEKQLSALQKKLAEARSDLPMPVQVTNADPLPADWVKALSWRCIGPANMGGRIVAISVFEADPTTYWIATASGGLLKTVNNGVTFEHQFDHEATVSIGDICVAPSNKDIVWVGTGENNPRNSVSYGDGVYKSTDGGKTWTNMGLKKSFQIGRIRIHPSNPDVVYVGVLGRLYGPSEERGLYKTSDGGKTWQKVLSVDDRTGVIDLRMHPADPETLLVATYERKRDGFDGNEPATRFGAGAGIWKTSDGGKNFRRITSGLPNCKLGRIGLDWYRKDPTVVYAIVESEKCGMGPPGVVATAPAGNGTLGLLGEDAGENKGVRLTIVQEGGPAERAGLEAGDVIVKVGDKPIPNFEELIELMREHRVGDRVHVKVLRGDREKEADLTFVGRPGRGGGGGGGGLTDPTRPFASQLAGQQENIQDKQGPDGAQYGGLFRSADGGETWQRVNSINPRPMYFSQVRVDPSDDKNVYVLGVSLYRSTDGGKTCRPDGGRGVHPDHHALWIDPRDGRHMILGCDGGFYVTYDRMATWDHHNHMAFGQFYHVAIDTRADYHVYGGLQDNGSWGGPSRLRTFTGPVNEDWISIGGGDGFRCQVDPNDPDQIYYTSQNGAMGRRNLRTGETGAIRPPGAGRGPQGGAAATPPARPAATAEQIGFLMRSFVVPPALPLPIGQPGTPAARGPVYRWNWNTPFILSHHNSKIFYCAANVVFRSLDRGNNLLAISPEITATKEGSATALSESPKNPNVIYTGTDDGNLWVTRDGGKEWVNITKNVGLPGLRWVASIEASRYEEGRAYVVFDGHRSDDDEPYVYVTEDFGKTWQSLRANLPWGSTRVCREDIANPDLLFLGTEFGAWASVDRGKSWTKINNNLPTVAVHEFAIHPTAGEIVAATHGRSIWICDVTALRQITTAARKADAFLYKPTAAVRWRTDPGRGRTGRHFTGENPPQGATLWYSLDKKAEKASVKIIDIEGKTVRELPADTSPGLHKVSWNLASAPPRQIAAGGGEPGGQRRQRAGTGGGAAPAQRPGTPEGAAPAQRPGGEEGAAGGAGGGFGGGGFGGGRGGFGGQGGRPVAPGAYKIVLSVDGKEYVQSIRVLADPAAPADVLAEEQEDEDGQ
jgi:photosystem II stability/assembly factor-like uncharacterized protein